jgi:hypothetical protein
MSAPEVEVEMAAAGGAGWQAASAITAVRAKKTKRRGISRG